jgi:hypothetical protein
MYRGYWIWLIPVSEHVDSIGVVHRHDQYNPEIRNEEDFVGWLKQHRWATELLGDRYELIDFMGLKSTRRNITQYFSTDRWFITGMAGYFQDTLGSGTCRAIAFNNQLIGRAIQADLDGDAANFESRCRHFSYEMIAHGEGLSNAFGRYQYLGSYDLWYPWYWAILTRHYNRDLPDAFDDFRRTVATADSHVGGCACSAESVVERATKWVTALGHRADEFLAFLDKTGNYYSSNKGQFADEWQAVLNARRGIWDKIVDPPDLEAADREDVRTYHEFYRRYLRRMAQLQGIECTPEDLLKFAPHWTENTSLEAGLAQLRGA